MYFRDIHQYINQRSRGMKAMAGNLVAAHSTYQSTSVGVKRLSGSAAGFFASLKVSVQRNRQVYGMGRPFTSAGAGAVSLAGARAACLVAIAINLVKAAESKGNKGQLQYYLCL
eukprot:845910-Rhodomonas_salina.1